MNEEESNKLGISCGQNTLSCFAPRTLLSELFKPRGESKRKLAKLDIVRGPDKVVRSEINMAMKSEGCNKLDYSNMRSSERQFTCELTVIG